MTPEGEVKRDFKDWLKTIIVPVYVHWPVQMGMGSPELDCNLVVAGFDWTIECKAPGEQLTARQRITMQAKQAAGGIVLVIEGTPNDYEALNKILDDLIERAWPYAHVVANHHRHEHPYRYRDKTNG